MKPTQRRHCSKLNTTMEKGMSSGKRKNKSQVYKKKNGSKETIT